MMFTMDEIFLQGAQFKMVKTCVRACVCVCVCEKQLSSQMLVIHTFFFSTLYCTSLPTNVKSLLRGISRNAFCFKHGRQCYNF